MPENAGIQEVLEILRFGGRGLSLLGKGILLTGRFLKGVGAKTNIAITQLKLALSNHHSATQANYHMLSLNTLEKITGGSYEIVRIPTENPEEIAEFCNMVKKYKINAAVMKDLNVGDGMTEIAYNPEHSSRMQVLMEKYNHLLKEKAKSELSEKELAHNIDFNEYANNADPKQKKEFISETVEELKEKQKNETPSLSPNKGDMPENVIDFQSRKEKIKSIINNTNKQIKKSASDYFCFDVEKAAIVAETDKGYTVKVPNSYNKETNSFKMMNVKKDAVSIDGDRAKIFVKKDGSSIVTDSKNKDKNNLRTVEDNKKLFKNYFSKAKEQQKGKSLPTPSPKKRK